MTVRLLLFRGSFIHLWVGDFGNPDSLGDLDVFYQNPVLVDLCWEQPQFSCKQHHLLHLLHLCIAWLCSGSETGKETPQIIFWHILASAPDFCASCSLFSSRERLQFAGTSCLSPLNAQFCWMCAVEKGSGFPRCSHRCNDFKGKFFIQTSLLEELRASMIQPEAVPAGWVVFSQLFDVLF